MQGLAAYVLDLADDDARLIELAAAFPDYHRGEDFPMGGTLGTRCFEFTRGNDPDRWFTEYTRHESMSMRRLYGQ